MKLTAALCERLGVCCVLLNLGVVMTACHSVKTDSVIATDTPNQAALVSSREAVLRELKTFTLSGALGIWTDEESISAKIDWQQSPGTLRLRLTGPLSMGNMVLRDDGNDVTLRRGNQLLASGQTSDAVLQRGLSLAAPVPLEQIRLWIRGLPGNASSIVRDSQGRLSSLRFRDEQGTGWQARFLRYSQVEDVSLPALITASGGPFSVRLRLKSWQLMTNSVVPETPQSNKRLAIPDR